jgi:hypothetical protein
MFALECGASTEVVRLLLDNNADAIDADTVLVSAFISHIPVR